MVLPQKCKQAGVHAYLVCTIKVNRIVHLLLAQTVNIPYPSEVQHTSTFS